MTNPAQEEFDRRFAEYLESKKHAVGEDMIPEPQQEREQTEKRKLLILNNNRSEITRKGSKLKAAIEEVLKEEDHPMPIMCQYIGQLEEFGKKMSDFYAAFVNPAREDALRIIYEMQHRPDFEVFLFRGGEAYIERDDVLKRLGMIFKGDYSNWKNGGGKW